MTIEGEQVATPATPAPLEPAEAIAASDARHAPLVKPRDRVVVLGRRRAGKTIFLARLYEQLWNSRSHFHMRAISGETHKACMRVIEELQSGRWPASTLGAQYSDIEVSYRGRKQLLVALDYPGEVFHKAFVEDADSADARELLDHVDRAAAVILLLDPAVVRHGPLDEAIDDDFGMTQAIHRIREWPGGNEVPIVVVFTKSDMRLDLLRSAPSLAEFASKHYLNLVRVVGRFKVFAASAVRARQSGDGHTVPEMGKAPSGLVEPLEYCLIKIIERDETRQQEREEAEKREAVAKFLDEKERAHKRAILFWSLFWSIAAVLLTGIAIVTWLIFRPETLP